MTKNDNVREIESLSPLEHVRLRSDVYAGDCSDATQLIIEILGNSIDEYNIGYGKEIIVKVDNKNHIYSVEDCGRGFPINEPREDGETTLQASFDVLNTSGKFRNDGSYAGVSLGKNGQGGKLTNFLSHSMKVYSCRNYNYELVQFKEGVFQGRNLGESTKEHGTTVTFNPSEEFFDSPTINESKVKQFCNEITCLCPGLVIDYNGKKIFHENGIADLLSSQVKDNIEIVSNRFIEEFAYGKQGMSIGLTYTSASSSSIISYVNCGLTNAGPHIASMKSTITRILNKWAKENHLLGEKDKNLDGASLQEGLILVSNITAENVKYEAQVKSTVTKIDTDFASIFGQKLEVWLDSNPEDAKAILDKAILARKAAEAAKRARAAVKNKKKNSEYIKMPTTLSDCWSKNRSECELIICEGKSAQSGLVAARDSKTQAIYGVRGMMISARKTTVQKFLKNQEVNNLLIALGLDVDSTTGKIKYDVNKLRYGKIIACADADAPGAAIENLLFNILWYICPELIQNGHVYSAVPPLFRVTTKNNEYVYLKDSDALEEYKKKHNNKIKSIGREKGLGEMDSEELGDTLLNASTRNIVQLCVSDVNKTEQIFEDLYGKAVQPRVDYILNHSENGEVSYE
mgnify:FL=1